MESAESCAHSADASGVRVEGNQNLLGEGGKNGGATAEGGAEEQRQRVADERQTERRAREREREELRGRARNLVQESHKIQQPPAAAAVGGASAGGDGAEGNAPAKQDPGGQLGQL